MAVTGHPLAESDERSAQPPPQRASGAPIVVGVTEGLAMFVEPQPLFAGAAPFLLPEQLVQLKHHVLPST